MDDVTEILLERKKFNMAVKSKEEILEQIKAKLGEDTSDEAIGLVEDISDTLSDIETRLSDNTDWRKKYEENDKEWREKYRNRFFNPDNSNDTNIGAGENEVPEPEADAELPTKFEDLFSTKEE